MAVTCARCGTQNPDGNRFCQSCGTPLAPAVAPAPAVPVGATAATPFPQAPPAVGAAAAPGYAAAPAYAAPQPGYQSPYYQPPPGTQMPAVHRTPWILIIGVIVAVVVVLSGVGTVLAFSLNHSSNPKSGGIQSSLPSPSPAATPSAGQPSSQPSSQPSAQPSQPATGGQTVAVNTLSVVVPSGWSVVNKDSTSVTLQSPNGDGTLTIASGQSSPPETAQQLKSDIDKALGQKYPDVAECPSTSVTNGSLAGANGVFWVLCFTATSGGQSVPIAEPLWVGANANGSVAYIVVLQTTQDNIDAFVKACVPILTDGITWKLK